jgi:hypothetical protein
MDRTGRIPVECRPKVYQNPHQGANLSRQPDRPSVPSPLGNQLDILTQFVPVYPNAHTTSEMPYPGELIGFPSTGQAPASKVTGRTCRRDVPLVVLPS